MVTFFEKKTQHHPKKKYISKYLSQISVMFFFCFSMYRHAIFKKIKYRWDSCNELKHVKNVRKWSTTTENIYIDTDITDNSMISSILDLNGQRPCKIT
jgi:hypothetical protein